MTSNDRLKAKAMLAILETIDLDDDDDAKQAVKMIRTILDNGKPAAQA